MWRTSELDDLTPDLRNFVGIVLAAQTTSCGCKLDVVLDVAHERSAPAKQHAADLRSHGRRLCEPGAVSKSRSTRAQLRGQST